MQRLVRLVMRPEFKGNLTQAAIHQLYEKQEARRKKKESGVMIGLKKNRGYRKTPKGSSSTRMLQLTE